MKNLGHLKLALVASLLATVPFFANAKSDVGSGGGSSVGGGAGCIGTDGKIIMLYECGQYTPKGADAPDVPLPIDGSSENPPGLAELINFVKEFKYFTPETKTKLLKAITPSPLRKYFTMIPKEFDEKTQTRILFQFKRAINIEPNKLGIFAATDTDAKLSYIPDTTGKITYLVGFNQIATKVADLDGRKLLNARMAALFHEAWWVLNPQLTNEADAEKQATQAEMALHAVLDNPSDSRKQYELVKIFETGIKTEEYSRSISYKKYEITINVIKLALKSDLESGALNGFVNDKAQFTNLQLFGVDNLNCFNNASEDFEVQRVCYINGINYMNGLRRQYPNSQFLNLVGKYLIQSVEWYYFVRNHGGMNVYLNEDWAAQYTSGLYSRVFRMIQWGSNTKSSFRIANKYWQNVKCRYFLGVCATLSKEMPLHPLEQSLFEYKESGRFNKYNITEVVMQINPEANSGMPLLVPDEKVTSEVLQ